MTTQTTTHACSITGLDLVGATVSDVPRSLAFYRDALGLQPSYVADSGAEFEFPNGETFGIWKPDGGEFPIGVGVMFTVADAAAAVEACNARGANIPAPFASPVCKMAIGNDPDGNGFILHERTQKNDPVAPPHVKSRTSVNGIDWAGYIVTDAKRAHAFYKDVLGLTPTYEYESGRGVEYDLADGTTFGIWQGEPGQKPAGSLMFAVTDAVAKVAELRERGVQISDAEDLDNCWMAHTADPDGIHIIIHQRKI